MKPKVYIIILNWNGWQDTLECLEAVMRSTYPAFQVVLCDNDSTDGSMSKIREWAGGRIPAPLGAEQSSFLATLSTPPIEKPVSFAELDRNQAERGRPGPDRDADLVLIQTGANLGFAGGNNVGLRYAMKRGDFDFVWLLNNDTVVAPDCLERMVAYASTRPRPSTCGSRILFYDNPDVIQALGGARYNKWTGLSSMTLGRYRSASENIDAAEYERRLSYITGASWMLPRSFLTDIGLMEEGYFLYCEEIDWCVRSAGKYDLCFADDARVYHKEGRSIGSPSGGRSSSLFSDYHIFRNKLDFTRRYFPRALPTAYLTTFFQALNRARRGQWDKAWLIINILLGRRRSFS